MIRFSVSKGLLRPALPEDASRKEIYVAETIATRLNKIQGSNGDYKALMQGIDKILLPDAKNFIDTETIQQIEDFYEKASGITPWDSEKIGKGPDEFDAKFYAGLVPEEVEKWNDAQKSITFAGKKIADADITKQYKTLDDFLNRHYTQTGFSGGLPGKKREFASYLMPTETLRPPTDREKQILRETLLGGSSEEGGSPIERATQKYVDKQGEQAFGALSADALKQTLDNYSKVMKQDQMGSLLKGMGLTDPNSVKQNIKDSILGDLGSGGFLGFGQGLSKALDKSLGMGTSVKYNWEKWFDETLAQRYENMKEIQDPTDAEKAYQLEKQFASDFVNKYLKPRFDNSKSISEFISYMDVKEDEQNVLQTQLVSSSLKDTAKRQAEAFLYELGRKTEARGFDPDFYFDPDILSGTDVQDKKEAYTAQKEDVNKAWENRNSDLPAGGGTADGAKTWKRLAYEYGLDVNNKADFARLHYAVIGANKRYDGIADTYTSRDLQNFIKNDLAKVLENEKASFSNPVFLDFVSSESKTQELVDKLNLDNLPAEYVEKFKELGINTNETPVEQVKEYLAEFLRTDPASAIRQQIRILNEERIKPTQEELGVGYIQRDEDEKPVAPAGGTALFNVFKKAGYNGSENEFYRDFFPDATEEDKALGKVDGKLGKNFNAQNLLGFSMPDMSDPFAAMASIGSMFEDTSSQDIELPTKQNYFNIFSEEKDEGAPSYFKIKGNTKTSKVPSPQDFLSDFGSVFG